MVVDASLSEASQVSSWPQVCIWVMVAPCNSPTGVISKVGGK